jgi:hypothetical protein
MSASLRFLVLIALGWAAFRAGAFWSLPGAEAFTIRAKDAPVETAAKPATGPAVQQVSVPVAEPETAYGYPPYPAYAGYPPQPGYPAYAPYPQAAPVPVRIPVYYPAYYPVRQATGPAPVPDRYTPAFDLAPPPPRDEGWSLAQLAPLPDRPRAVSAPVATTPPVPGKLDRLQLSSWALLRGRTTGSTLASGGTLGGSQAGARLTYAFDRGLAAQLRTTSPVGGGRGVEVALGARYQPLRSIPVWINAERRQSIGDYGRSDFAVFAEGGLYQRPLPWNFSLDAYLQGGLVGIGDRDLFVDGGFTMTRPLFRNYSLGFGAWGGAQPGLFRVDAGPRLSMKVRNNIRVHADWRQRLAGRADPGSGPALTLAADF